MMLELSRRVRLAVTPSADGRQDSFGPKHNPFAAWPPLVGLDRFYEIQVICRGQADPQTGYFLNITQVDQVVRQQAMPILRQAVAQQEQGQRVDLAAMMRRMVDSLQGGLMNSVTRVALELSPYTGYAMGADAMSRLHLRQQYEFSAAHRLHVASLSDCDNQRIFGKCNHSSGHGHNYRLEVVAGVPGSPGPDSGWPAAMDAIVDRVVLQAFDHRNLNVDLSEFAGQNPSVENISQVIHDRLRPELALAGWTLAEVTVWETSKTSCTCRSPQVDDQR